MKYLFPKRFAIALGLIALLGATLVVQQAFAAVTGSLAIGSATAAPGSTVTVNLTTNVPNPGLGAWTVDVVVENPGQVSVVSCAAESHSVCNATYRMSPPTVRFAGASAVGLVGSRTLGSVTLRCASSEGTSDLNLDTVGYADATLGGPIEIAVTMDPGTIRCTRGAPTSTRVGTSTPGAAATATHVPPGGFPSTGTGGGDSGNALPELIAMLAGAGAAVIVGYRLLRARTYRA